MIHYKKTEASGDLKAIRWKEVAFFKQKHLYSSSAPAAHLSLIMSWIIKTINTAAALTDPTEMCRWDVTIKHGSVGS